MNKWFFNNTTEFDIPETAVGFIYCITNLDTNRKYVGQKRLTRKVTRKPLKGKTQRRHSRVESDWQTYWGSSEALKADVLLLGDDKFKREILFFCNSKAEMNYRETKEQFDREVLFKDEYYNGIINIRTTKNQLTQYRKSLGK